MALLAPIVHILGLFHHISAHHLTLKTGKLTPLGGVLGAKTKQPGLRVSVANFQHDNPRSQGQTAVVEMPAVNPTAVRGGCW